MGFLGKLFGKSDATPAGGGGKISVYAVCMQSGIATSSKKCDLDGRTFPCPANPPTIFTLDTSSWALDIGGYCPRCSGYRCERHAKFGEQAQILCAKCGTELTGGPN